MYIPTTVLHSVAAFCCRTEKADSAVFAVGSSLNNRYFENFYYYFCLYNQIYKMFLISFQ